MDKRQLACLERDKFKTTGTDNYEPHSQSATFEIWDEDFLPILGDNPRLELLVESPDYAFAWEARSCRLTKRVNESCADQNRLHSHLD